MKRAMILFTRALENGEVKSRMSAALSAVQRQDLHRAFLCDLKASMTRAQHLLGNADIVLCSTSSTIPVELEETFGSTGVIYLQQEGARFRERLINAFARTFELGYASCVLIGSDCVTTSGEDIAGAFDELTRAPAVVEPSADGGFCLAGLSRNIPQLFDVTGYGTNRALDAIMTQAGKLGVSCTLLEPREDADTLFDLQCLYRKARNRSDAHLPHATIELLERLSAQGTGIAEAPVSVIVPVYNEASALDTLTCQLEALSPFCEVIIVDGDSSDGTFEELSSRFRAIRSAKGRGPQQNAGAAVARGDILLFLHADSLLPQDALRQVRSVSAIHRAGCFKIAFDRPTLATRCCAAWSNLRASRRHIMFGDQGIFIERALFEKLGGFANIPLMEDYQLSLDLKAHGVRSGMAQGRILTSSRRFGKGMLHQIAVMCQMASLRRRYRAGEDPADLADEYRNPR